MAALGYVPNRCYCCCCENLVGSGEPRAPWVNHNDVTLSSTGALISSFMCGEWCYYWLVTTTHIVSTIWRYYHERSELLNQIIRATAYSCLSLGCSFQSSSRFSWLAFAISPIQTNGWFWLSRTSTYLHGNNLDSNFIRFSSMETFCVSIDRTNIIETSIILITKRCTAS